MNDANDVTLMVDDLAGHWTEPALEILKSAGVGQISVEMEVETWQTMKRVLHSELRWQRVFRSSTLVSLSSFMEQVLRRTTLLMAEKFAFESPSHEFEIRIGRLASERRSKAAERRLYAQLVCRPELRSAFKPPSRTDFVPRLHVANR